MHNCYILDFKLVTMCVILYPSECGDGIYKRAGHTAVVYGEQMFVFGVCLPFPVGCFLMLNFAISQSARAAKLRSSWVPEFLWVNCKKTANIIQLISILWRSGAEPPVHK